MLRSFLYQAHRGQGNDAAKTASPVLPAQSKGETPGKAAPSEPSSQEVHTIIFHSEPVQVNAAADSEQGAQSPSQTEPGKTDRLGEQNAPLPGQRADHKPGQQGALSADAPAVQKAGRAQTSGSLRRQASGWWNTFSQNTHVWKAPSSAQYSLFDAGTEPAAAADTGLSSGSQTSNAQSSSADRLAANSPGKSACDSQRDQAGKPITSFNASAGTKEHAVSRDEPSVSESPVYHTEALSEYTAVSVSLDKKEELEAQLSSAQSTASSASSSETQEETQSSTHAGTQAENPKEIQPQAVCQKHQSPQDHPTAQSSSEDAGKSLEQHPAAAGLDAGQQSPQQAQLQPAGKSFSLMDAPFGQSLLTLSALSVYQRVQINVTLASAFKSAVTAVSNLFTVHYHEETRADAAATSAAAQASASAPSAAAVSAPAALTAQSSFAAPVPLNAPSASSAVPENTSAEPAQQDISSHEKTPAPAPAVAAAPAAPDSAPAPAAAPAPALKLKLSVGRLKDVFDFAVLEYQSSAYEVRTNPLPGPARLTAIWEDRLKKRTHLVILARNEADGKLIGFASIEKPFVKGYIRAVYIAPQYFRSGVGKTLVEACFNHLRLAGAKKAVLEVEKHNQGAKAFYEALNFKPSAVQSTPHLMRLEKEL